MTVGLDAAAQHRSDAGIVRLGEEALGVEAVAAVARGGAGLALGSAARTRVEAARAVVDRLAAEDAPVYGLTTGLGANVDTRLPLAELAAAQRRLVLSRSVALGAPLAREAVRAVMAARAAGMAAGGSGVSPHVLEALIALVNAGVHPRVPGKGSIGMADLPQLAHVALTLLGEGEAEYRGDTLPSAEALRRAGLAPVVLGAKDGLALISANAASVGPGALAAIDAEAAVEALAVAAALSFEGFRANLSPLHPRAVAAREAPGQRAASERLTALLAGSALWQPGAARRLQDPLSLRCTAPVLGAVLDALAQARHAVEIELNGAGDSPLVLSDEFIMLSTANFDVTALALAFEHLGQALAHLAALSAERTLKLLSPAFSELPRFLSPRGQTRTGFAAVAKPLAALEAEIRALAQPASLGVINTAERVEDHATMAPRVVEKTAEIVGRLHWLAAIELMVAAQALDLRPAPLGAVMAAVYGAVRALVPTLDEDRILAPDIERLAAAVAGGRLKEVVQQHLGAA